MAFYYVSQFSIIAVTLLKFENIKGWGVYEMAFLYALILMAQSFNTLFFGPLIRFDEEIKNGGWDLLLTKPVNPLLALLAGKFDLTAIAHFLLGLTAIIVATMKLSIELNILNTFWLLVTCLGGALILASIRLIVASVAFYAVSIQSLVHFFVFSSKEFILYPINIYKSPIPFVLTFLFPLAFVNFYPAQLFLNKEYMFAEVFKYVTLPLGIIMFITGMALFERGKRSYHSTGT